jgi:hypothetical protein
MTKYAAIRDTIKSGHILTWTHRSWETLSDIESQVVRIITESEYSHVGLAWVFGGRVFVLESVVPKIRIVPLSNLLPCYLLTYQVTWTEAAETFALSLVGNGLYSKWEAILGLFRKIRHSDSVWQCAKYVWCVLDKTDRPIELNGLLTPSAVVQAALESGATLQSMEE